MMRILVCGGRDYDDRTKVFETLDTLKPSVIIEGGARGADWIAATWGMENRVPRMRFDADWQTHGKAAGPIRNQLMLDQGNPDLVLAFPGGKGTADCVRRARAAGIEVMEVAGCTHT
jgi:hypothetical protein